ncbi:MAG: hypothetical protein K2I46_06525 [Clostridia bacterium]|nr:hypothetical protein [Clostridia bacterium]MDE6471469.1 hypothetical protein [Clostridia bacterium]
MIYKKDMAKKRKRRILALDLIIGIIPMLYALIAVITMFTGDDKVLACFLAYGGLGMGMAEIASVIFRIIDEIYVFKLVDKYADSDTDEKRNEESSDTPMDMSTK